MEVAKYNTIPTHIIHPGAHIKVETKSGRGFAWAVARSEFQVSLQPRKLEPHIESAMRLFLAISGFMACYPEHEYKEYAYDAMTRIYAFINPEDGLVTRMQKPKKEWRQDGLI